MNYVVVVPIHEWINSKCLLKILIKQGILNINESDNITETIIASIIGPQCSNLVD